MVIGGSTLRRLVRARELLAGGDLGVEAVADAVAISRAHFIRQFESVFGTTPHQFRTQRRLERARGLLAAGASVTEACLAVGFSSIPSFSRLFARHVGEPPSSYHRRSVAVPGRPPHCFELMALLPFRTFG